MAELLLSPACLAVPIRAKRVPLSKEFSTLKVKDHLGYIQHHWQGKHALLLALCANLILFADRYTLPHYIPDRITALIATVVFILVFHGVVFVWQVVGVL